MLFTPQKTITHAAGRETGVVHLLLAVVCLLIVTPRAQAEQEDAPDFVASTMSGDWRGLRTRAWDAGWHWDAALKVDTQHNRGGARNGLRSMTNLDLRLKADLSRIADWDGATAYLHILDNRGSGLNSQNTGSLMGVSNIEVPTPATRVFHAWLQQNFLDDQLTLLGGLYPIDSEFFVMDSASALLHPAYGTAANLGLTHGPSIFNNSALGVRLKWQSPQRTLYAQGALLDGVPNDPAHPRRTAIRLGNGDGTFGIFEFGWTPKEFGHLFEPTLPVSTLKTPALVTHEKYEGTSKIAVGFWRYGNRVRDQFAVDTNGEAVQRHSQGAYLLAERTLLGLGDVGRDLTAFARYSVSDGYATPIDRTWNIGLRVRGPLSNRPDDQFLIGWTTGLLSPGFRSAQAAQGTATASAEDQLEIAWRAALTKWFALQPNLQLIRNPGGDSTSKRATVIGVRLEMML